MNKWLTDAWQDLGFALRLFRRRPDFAVLAAVTLAFGIGATTAVYTIVHAVLLRSPYSDPNRIVVIGDNNSRRRPETGHPPR
jgi:putative ABC transport system permease protein